MILAKPLILIEEKEKENNNNITSGSINKIKGIGKYFSVLIFNGNFSIYQ